MSGGWENAGVKKSREFFPIFFFSQKCEVEMGSCELLKKNSLIFRVWCGLVWGKGQERERKGWFFLKKIFNLKNEKLRFWSTRVLHVVAWSWLRGRCQAPRNVDFRKINKNQTRATLAKFGWCAVVFVEHFYFYYFHTLSVFFTVKLLIIFLLRSVFKVVSERWVWGGGINFLITFFNKWKLFYESYLLLTLSSKNWSYYEADDERARRSERARHSEWGHKSGLNKLIASGDGAGWNSRRSDSTELNSI